MTERIVMGKDDGSFVARVARPGYSTSETDLTNFSLHEQQNVARPVYRQKHSLAANTQYSFTVSAIVGKIFYAILKSDEGYLPFAKELQDQNSAGPYWWPGTFYIRIRPSDGSATLYNDMSVPLNITVAIFAVEATV